MSKAIAPTERITNKVVPIEQIKPHKRNFREHPESQLTQLGVSHSRFGQYRSVVLWEQTSGEYITVAGHGIIEAMRRNSVQEVRADVLPPETPHIEIDAILAADNLHAQNAQDDETQLAALLQEQVERGFDLATLGTDDEALRQMLECLGDEARSSGRTTELNGPEGGEVTSSYNVLIECESEAEQARAYELAQEGGFTCKVLTL